MIRRTVRMKMGTRDGERRDRSGWIGAPGGGPICSSPSLAERRAAPSVLPRVWPRWSAGLAGDVGRHWQFGAEIGVATARLVERVSMRPWCGREADGSSPVGEQQALAARASTQQQHDAGDPLAAQADAAPALKSNSLIASRAIGVILHVRGRTGMALP
jgi:hypothetical protein